ncbi:hypothetical protein AQUCO_05700074v1 [Aquilegia coerulea]|uniref:Reverse transcriptase zinc-binding domain-containing protein n=1 Tax=Aquilegia coerulea TaxID=218851 RepID=A0A2G5CFV1_AQUCA|nr:hypothetical protein AQUCO_05700074v1 [Aquilegia coerulea]
MHLLLYCAQSKLVWRDIMEGVIDIDGLLSDCNSIRDLLKAWPHFPGVGLGAKIWKTLPYAVMWTIWNHRNRLIFYGKALDLNRISNDIKATVWYWAGRHPHNSD